MFDRVAIRRRIEHPVNLTASKSVQTVALKLYIEIGVFILESRIGLLHQVHLDFLNLSKTFFFLPSDNLDGLPLSLVHLPYVVLRLFAASLLQSSECPGEFFNRHVPVVVFETERTMLLASRALLPAEPRLALATPLASQRDNTVVAIFRLFLVVVLDNDNISLSIHLL